MYGNMTPAELLTIQRSSIGIKFLENVLHVLTLGCYSRITKGTFVFWKTHGELTVDAIQEISHSVKINTDEY
ncbi:MAG: hypothetical protein QM652_03495 [Legionella sp.]|uniref:hypothetical protein n=1 Tax=Legionella sp. TaxID=459 RepID=UPI0039E6C681